MHNLPKPSDCTGCGVCIDVCRKKALSHIIDHNGFVKIVTDESLCITCGACETVCPSINPPSTMKCAQPFWCWTKDERVRKNSTSGGAFAQLAYDFFQIHTSAIVVGAQLVEGSHVKHIAISSPKDIVLLQGTIHIQSKRDDIYNQVSNFLKQGRHVLFSGTPCQVAAMRNRCPKAFAKHLVTIEVICHGLPSRILFELSLKLNKAKRIITFRNKPENQWGLGCEPVYDTFTEKYNGYFYDCYFNDFFLKPACYQCKFAQIPRVADISIADGWGIQHSGINNVAYKPGASLMIINSEKGREIINWNSFESYPAKWEQFIPSNPCVITNLSYLKPLSLSNQIHRILRLPFGLMKYVFALRSPNKGWGLIAKPYIIIMLKLKNYKEKIKNKKIYRFLNNIQKDETFRIH